MKRSVLGSIFKRSANLTIAFVLTLSSVSIALPLLMPSNVSAAAITVCSGGCDAATLQAAIDTAASGDTLTLAGDVVAENQVTINKSLTLDGDGHTISPTFTKPSPATGQNNAALGIENTSGVIVKNITIDGTNGTAIHGINAYKATATLTNVTTKNNKRYGIVVNGSDVTITNINTQANGWGGIDVDQASTSNPALLTVTGSSFHTESFADIFVDNTTKPVSVVDTNLQYTKTNSGVTRYYKLSPKVSACAITTTVNSTSLAGWNLSETRANGHNEIVSNGLRIWTDTDVTGSPDPRKAAGYYPVNFALKNLGDKTIAQSLVYEAAYGTAPGLQVVVDFDNNNTPDGTLVGETVYGNNWWLTNGSAQFAKDGAPNNGGGNGSQWYGTPNQWLSSFPNANVVAIGYSLGGGVNGDGVIKKLSFGCNDYTFSLPAPLTAPTNLLPANGSYTPNPAFQNSWSTVEGAAKYEYRVSNTNNDADANGKLVNGLGLSDDLTYSTTNSRMNNSGTPQDTYYWQVRAIDANGVTGPWSVIHTVTYDVTKPSLPVHTSPANNSIVVTNDFYFNWTAATDASPVKYEFQSSGNNTTDGTGSLVGAWNSAVNGNDEQKNLTSPTIHSTGAPDGSYYWQVRAIDAAGNTSAWTNPWKMTIDSTPPAVPANLTLVDNASQNIANGSSTQSFDVTASWDATGDTDHYVYRVWTNIPGNAYNGEGNAYTVDNNSTSRAGAFNQGEGTYYIQVRSVDANGNKSDWTPVFAVTYDISAPVVTVNSPAENALTITGSVSEPVQVFVTIGGASPVAATMDGLSWSVPVPADLADGSYAVSASAADALGNTTNASSVNPLVISTAEQNDDDETTPITQTPNTITPLFQVLGTTTSVAAGRATRVALLDGSTATPFQSDVLAAQTTVDGEPMLTDGEDAATGSNDKEESKSCGSFLGLCWYWWVIIVAGLVTIYFVIRSISSDKRSSK